MNLIPERMGGSPHYWCTWGVQNRIPENADAADYLGAKGAQIARDSMNEESIFGKNGWADLYPETRGDLYMLFDDGWDVPHGTNPGEHIDRFGSLIPEAERFPSFPGTPMERLRGINQELRKRGWRGLGIWISPNGLGETYQHCSSLEAIRPYWEERLNWSAEAGIEYWKVDWGAHSADLEFRRMLTGLARQIAPRLVVEQACPGPGFNGLNLEAPEEGSGRFLDAGDNRLRRIALLQQFSEMTRIYDLTGPLGNTVGLDRLAFYLMTSNQGWLNVEDELYMGCAAGCCFGVMRFPGNPREKNRCQEVARAVHWQRIAPAFKSGGEPVYSSFRVLTNSWTYTKDDTWCGQVVGKKISQSAPQCQSRNMPLPKTESREADGALPHVVASKHPNGAVAVGTFPRVSDEKGTYYPHCRVCLPEAGDNRTIGIFGDNVEVEIPVAAAAVKVYAQDLADNEARELNVPVTGGKITLTETLLATVARTVDESAQGTALRIVPA